MRKRGFTLVELLVVIGIIALLIAMLLPALNKARKQASSLQCMSNLRSIMLAVQYYAADNGNAMVPAYWSGGTGASTATPSPTTIGYPTFWWAALPSDAWFLGKYTDHSKLVYDGTSNIWGRISNKRSVWLCPDNPFNDGPPNGPGILTSYALNLSTFPNISADSTHPTGWEYSWKLNQIRSPSRMMAFLDSTCERFNPGYGTVPVFYGNIAGGANNYNAGSAWCYYNHAIRHPSNQTNVSFMDGHVEGIQNLPYNGTLSLYAALTSGRFVLNRTDY